MDSCAVIQTHTHTHTGLAGVQCQADPAGHHSRLTQTEEGVFVCLNQ